MYWAIAIIVLIIGLYLDYTNGKQAIQARKAKELFLKNHPDSHMIQLSMSRVWLFGFLSFLCLGSLFIYLFSVFTSTTSEMFSQIVLYIGLFTFCLAMTMESYTLSRIAAAPDGFMVLSEYIRYKSIQSIEIGKGFFSSSSLTMMNGTTVSLSKSALKAIEPLWQEYKANRKLRKGKKRKARA